MKRDLGNLHLTNTMRTRVAVFGAGVCRVLAAVSAVNSAVSGLLATVPMVWGTSVPKCVMM